MNMRSYALAYISFMFIEWKFINGIGNLFDLFAYDDENAQRKRKIQQQQKSLHNEKPFFVFVFVRCIYN